MSILVEQNTRVGRICLLLLAMVLGAVGCTGTNASAPSGSQAAASDPKKDAELKWAREMAEDFLNDIVAGKWNNAAALTSKSYHNERWGRGFNAIKGEMDGTLDGHKPGQELTAWTIASQQIAPDQDEASFRGQLTGPQYAGEFTLRIIKQKDDGKWRVEQFSFRPQRQGK
jgi:hypothetical protein